MKTLQLPAYSLSPQISIILSGAPQDFVRNLSRSATVSSDIDDIENKCDKRVLMILMDDHQLIDDVPLDEYLSKDKEFQHKALPRFESVDSSDWISGSFSDISQINVYIKLAKLIKDKYYQYDGFVVVERVDKLAYTSSYLSFMLENVAKPVVFTSASSKISHCCNDAKLNLMTSFIVAGRSNINEVSVCFNRKVFRGSRVIRASATSYDSFASPNYSHLAQFGTVLIINKDLLLPATRRGFRINSKLFTDILVLYITPVTDMSLIEDLLCKSDVSKKGIVLSFYGTGNAPTTNQLKNILKQAIQQYECAIVITSQCLKGHVNMNVYATGSFFGGIGLINGGDMTLESAVAKLSCLMGKGLSGAELKNQFEKNFVGELTPIHLIKGRIVDYKTAKKHVIQIKKDAKARILIVGYIQCVQNININIYGDQKTIIDTILRFYC
eukprot:235393_1